MRIKIFAYSILICLFYTSLNASTYREKFEKTFRLDKGGELFLTNTNGSVIIESWDRNEVRVEAEKEVKAGSRRQAEEIMARIRIKIDHRNDYLRIETDLPKYRNGFWNSLFGDGVSISVTYRLYVPDGLKIDINTVNGKIDISEVAGRIKLKTTNGRIEVYEAKGSVEAKTTNGSIKVELLDFDEDEDMSFRTTNGGITVYFPDNFHAYIDARTTNGSVRTDFPIEVRGEISKHRLKGKINGGGGRITLYTTNGGVKILER